MCAIMGIGERGESKQKKRDFALNETVDLLVTELLCEYINTAQFILAVPGSAVACSGVCWELNAQGEPQRHTLPTRACTAAETAAQVIATVMPSRHPCVFTFESVRHDAEVCQNIGTR
jgi:hypothetical protein